MLSNKSSKTFKSARLLNQKLLLATAGLTAAIAIIYLTNSYAGKSCLDIIGPAESPGGWLDRLIPSAMSCDVMIPSYQTDITDDGFITALTVEEADVNGYYNSDCVGAPAPIAGNTTYACHEDGNVGGRVVEKYPGVPAKAWAAVPKEGNNAVNWGGPFNRYRLRVDHTYRVCFAVKDVGKGTAQYQIEVLDKEHGMHSLSGIYSLPSKYKRDYSNVCMNTNLPKGVHTLLDYRFWVLDDTHIGRRINIDKAVIQARPH